MAALKDIYRDLPSYLVARTVPALAAILGITLYTRLLSPGEYGYYILVITTVAIVNAFGFNWIGYVIWRYLERHRERGQSGEFLSTLLNFAAGALALTALLWLATVYVLRGHIAERLGFLLNLGVALLAVQVGFSLVLEYLRNSGMSRRFSVLSSLVAIGALAIAAPLIYFMGFAAEGILYSSIAVTGVVLLNEGFRIFRQNGLRPLYISRQILAQSLSFGLPQIGVAAGATLLAVMDRYMVAGMIGAGAAGIYTAGYMLSDYCIQFPLQVFTLAASPVIVRAHEREGSGRATAILKRISYFYFLFFVPVAFGLAALAADITGLLLGRGYESSSEVIAPVAAGVFCFGLTQITNLCFQLHEKPRVLGYMIACSAVANMLLNLLLIPRYGIAGAAYATFGAYFLYLAVSLWLTHKRFDLKIGYTDAGRCLAAGAVMFAGLSLIENHVPAGGAGLLIKAPAGALIYLLSMAALGGRVFSQELKSIKELLDNTFRGNNR